MALRTDSTVRENRAERVWKWESVLLMDGGVCVGESERERVGER